MGTHGRPWYTSVALKLGHKTRVVYPRPGTRATRHTRGGRVQAPMLRHVARHPGPPCGGPGTLRHCVWSCASYGVRLGNTSTASTLMRVPRDPGFLVPVHSTRRV